MKVCVISANLGAYDRPNDWPDLIAPDGVTVDVHRFTDANFPPRPLAMTSRLQCGLVKWFGPHYVRMPGDTNNTLYDVYIWVDASCAPTPIFVSWWLEHLGNATMAVFAHPERKTVRDEYEFMKARMARPGEAYLNSRYKGEWLDEEYAACDPDAPLVASTSFAYRWGYHNDNGNSGTQMSVMRFVWEHKTRFHLHDQLAFSTALHRFKPYHHRINESYLRCPALTFTRKKT